jgi:signal transduction histidine kinase
MRGSGSARTSTQQFTPSSMSIVVDELDRMEHLVRKLLYFSKQRKLNVQRVNLHDVIASALGALGKKFKENHIRLDTHLTLKNPFVSMDDVEMREVILNLLNNAIESLPRGGTIGVSTFAAGDGSTVGFKVQDSGKGIKPEVASKMFDPFFTTKETGTGLGLSICYEIVRAHSGSIDYSRGKKGSCFTVSLSRNHPKRAKAL